LSVWIFFEDGPLGPPDGGGGLGCKRAPRWLRGVRSAEGKVDALDQLDDEPAADEEIFVYRSHSVGHIRGATRAESGPMVMYRHVSGVDPNRLRDNKDWRELAAELATEAAA
jgi:hypothetical protein